MTETMNGLRQLTGPEREAVTMHMQKVPIVTIERTTGLSAPQIAAAVDQARVLAQASTAVPDAPVRPQSPAPVAFRPPAEPRAVDWNKELADTPGEGLVPAVKPPPITEPPRKLPSGALLLWADQQGPARAKTLAARIRESLKELYALHAGDTARAEAAAEVERLTAELEAAKARLREAGKTKAGAPAKAPTPPDRKAYLAAVRIWARARGDEVSDYGQIRKDICDAYDAEHEGES